MKLKFVLRSGDRETDLVATTDSATTVGDLASYLAAADPNRSSVLGVDAAMTLALVDQDLRGLDPRSTVAESGLQSGMRVSVTRAGEGFVDRGRPAAVARIRSGPDAGKEFPLAAGRHTSAEVGAARCSCPTSRSRASTPSSSSRRSSRSSTSARPTASPPVGSRSRAPTSRAATSCASATPSSRCTSRETVSSAVRQRRPVRRRRHRRASPARPGWRRSSPARSGRSPTCPSAAS